MKERKGKQERLYLRVSPQEKQKIEDLGRSCGLSTAEYIRKRALGFVPRAAVPDSFYSFNAKLSELLNRSLSPATETAALKLFDEIHESMTESAKQSVAEIWKEAAAWQVPDSGQSNRD